MGSVSLQLSELESLLHRGVGRGSPEKPEKKLFGDALRGLPIALVINYLLHGQKNYNNLWLSPLLCENR